MHSLNLQLSELRESTTVALADRVRRLRSSGRRVIGLQTGDPDFDTDLQIINAAHWAMVNGETHYCDSRGLPELRNAITESLQQDYGVEYDADSEILVTCGGIHAYYCALQALLAPGDEVLIPDPAWASHVNLVTLLLGKPVRIPSTIDDNFWPDLSEFENASNRCTSALVINSPNNPTGAVAESSYLKGIVDFAEENDLYIISDEVYGKLLYGDIQHTCCASLPGAKHRVILINSFSKTYAMTGWRVGYLAAPAHFIDQALKASQYSITSVSPFAQLAATCALVDPSVAQTAQKMLRSYARRRELVIRLFREHPTTAVEMFVPEGAFYFFLDIRRLGISSIEAAQILLEEVGVCMVPGSAFGDCGQGFLRMTIAAHDTDVEDGFVAFLDWADRVAKQRK